MNHSVVFWVFVMVSLMSAVAPSQVAILSLDEVAMSMPQEHVIDGPGDVPSTAREFDFNQDDLSRNEQADPRQRKKIELFLGVAFLLLVLLIAFYRRGKSQI